MITITRAQFRTIRRVLLGGSLLIVGAILFWRFDLMRFFSHEYVQERVARLESLVQHHYWRAVRVYIISFVITVVCGLPVTGLFAMAAGYLFGLMTGTLYTIIAAMIGSVISVLVVRYALSNFMTARYQTRLDHFNERMAKYGSGYLVTLQLLTVVPFFVINTLAALAGVSIPTVIWTTLVGATPPYFLYILTGKELTTIHSPGEILKPHILILFLLLALLSLAPAILRRFKRDVEV